MNRSNESEIFGESVELERGPSPYPWWCRLDVHPMVYLRYLHLHTVNKSDEQLHGFMMGVLERSQIKVFGVNNLNETIDFVRAGGKVMSLILPHLGPEALLVSLAERQLVPGEVKKQVYESFKYLPEDKRGPYIPGMGQAGRVWRYEARTRGYYEVFFIQEHIQELARANMIKAGLDEDEIKTQLRDYELLNKMETDISRKLLIDNHHGRVEVYPTATRSYDPMKRLVRGLGLFSLRLDKDLPIGMVLQAVVNRGVENIVPEGKKLVRINPGKLELEYVPAVSPKALQYMAGNYQWSGRANEYVREVFNVGMLDRVTIMDMLAWWCLDESWCGVRLAPLRRNEDPRGIFGCGFLELKPGVRWETMKSDVEQINQDWKLVGGNN